MFHVGERVTVLPSGLSSTVTGINALGESVEPPGHRNR
jgi:hypothetical protein